MHFVLQKLWLTVVSGPCLFSNALLCPDLWATVYTAAAAVIVYLFVVIFFSYRQRETIYGYHILANRKIGEGGGRVAWVCFEIVWRQSKLITYIGDRYRLFTVCLFIFLHFLFLLIFLSTFFSLRTCVMACRSRSSSYSLDQLSYSTEAGGKGEAPLPKLSLWIMVF